MDKNAIVITDLNGTFVYDSHTIRPIDRIAFHKLQERFYVGIATGRSPKEIAFVERVGNLHADYKICFNGAIVEDGNGKRIVDRPIPQTALRAVMQYLKATALTFDALDGERRIGNYTTNDKGRLWGMNLICLAEPHEAVAAERIYKINVRPGSVHFYQVLSEMQEHFPELGLYESDGKRIEVTAKNTNKGEAIKTLKMGFSGNVVGVGDSGNDVPMFEAADQAYCINQAPQAVKSHADVVLNHFADLLDYQDAINA